MSRAYDNAADGRYQQGGRRNLIINGAMEVAQRGTSFSNIAADTYVTDRWYVPHLSVTPDISQQSVTIGGETGLPSQFTKYARVDANVSGAGNLGVVTRVEDVQKQVGAHMLSFYAKGTNPTGGVFGCRFIQRFGSGGSSQVITDASDTFAVTSTWQRFEIPITMPSVSGKTIPTASNSYVQIQITQPNGDAGTDTFTLDITGVQFEAGTVATPFEHRSYGEELALCQRYYQKSFADATTPADSASYPWSLTGASFLGGYVLAQFIPFYVPMRDAPTITYYSSSYGTPSAGRWQIYDGGWTNPSALNASNITPNGFANSWTYSSATVKGAYYLAGHFTAEAEL